jgi:hypothetical protein
MVKCNTQQWTLDPRALGTAAMEGPGCLNTIVVKVYISHTNPKSGHHEAKTVSKINDIPSGKGEAPDEN